MRRRRLIITLTAIMLSLSCRHAEVTVRPLPDTWAELIGPPRPFAALYRLSCCGQRDLPTTVRGTGDRMAVAVAVPPGGVAFEAWITEARSWLRNRRDDCVIEMPRAVVPFGVGVDLPLNPAWVALLLSGRLPEGSKSLEGAPGWVEASSSEGWYRARVLDGPLRVAEVRVGRAREGNTLHAEVTGVGSTLPHRIDFDIGGEHVAMELVEYQPMPAETLAEPAWVGTLVRCREAR